jgi:hypothetical protein
LLRGGLGGWSISGISTYRTGFPVNVVAGPTGPTVGGMTDPIQYLGIGVAIDRPNVAGPIANFNPQPAGSAGAPSTTSKVNGSAISNYAQSLGLSQPLIGNLGNFGRNVLRLNGQVNFDWNLYKNFHFSERVNFQIRSEFYNIFNQHAFLAMGSVNAVIPITSSQFGQYTQVSQGARTIQVGARVVF